MKAGFPGRMTPATGFVFRPTQISGNVLWLDAADLGTITSSVGKVSQWNDKSGQGNNVTQGTGSAQPTTDATLQSGKNVLDFDGGDWLMMPSALHSLSNGPNTIFVVAATSLDTTLQRLVNLSESGSSRTDLQYTATTQQISYQSRNAGGGAIATSGITKASFNTIRGRRSGTTQAITFNNATEATNASGVDDADVDSATIGAFDDGASGFLTGSISEIIIYNSSLSTAELNQVETYLANKWGTG